MARTLRFLLPTIALVLAPLGTARAAEDGPARSTGPVFERWGAVYDDVVPDYVPPAEAYRVIFDVWQGPEEADATNPRLEGVARFLNMHARAGVDPEAMRLAVVLHGSAGRAVLRDDAYRTRFETANPDRELLEALAAKGVRFLICGQSAMYRGYRKAEMLAPVQVSLSASSAIMGLQAEGYHLLP